MSDVSPSETVSASQTNTSLERIYRSKCKVEPVETTDFISAMRRFPGGVSVVTTGKSGIWAGLTATAVVSLTAAPARLLCCMNLKGETMSKVRDAQNFCVNFLNVQSVDIAKRFAGMEDIGDEDRFVKNRWKTLKTGAPALIGAMASLDCEIEEISMLESHAILIGRVVATEVFGDVSPLVWAEGTFSKIQQLEQQA